MHSGWACDCVLGAAKSRAFRAISTIICIFQVCFSDPLNSFGLFLHCLVLLLAAARFMALSGLKDLFRGFVGNFSATAAPEDDIFRVSSGGERENKQR